MKFVVEKCAMLTSGKRHMTEGIELPNHEKLRSLGETETYKYLGILDPYTIKNAELKEKKKNTSGEPANYSNPN